MRPLGLLLLALLLAPASLAQTEVSLGADLVSRYVWRGFDFGQSFSAQPSLAVTSGGLEVGAWGSYAIASADANELDLYISYTAGPVTVGVTDYYFPSAPPDLGIESGADFFNFESAGDGAHYIEPFVTVSGGEALPLALTVAPMVYNDPAYSTYVEASYGFAINGTELGLAVGSVLALDPPEGTEGSALYGTGSDFAVTNVALSAGREIPLTESFSLPVFGQYVINPETERAFLLFGVSL